MTNKRKVFNLNEGRFPTYEEVDDETLFIKEGKKLNELFMKEVFALAFGDNHVFKSIHNHYYQSIALNQLKELIDNSRVKINAGGQSLRYPRGQEYLDDNVEWEKD
tara:strand:- start:80 stop:397 length:318 start_codon:yes stop_codon:yes gene_type:complete